LTNINSPYWLYIEPYVHISVKGNRALFYNTLNGSYLEYEGKEKILSWLGLLLEPQNGRVIEIKKEEIDTYPELREWIDQLKSTFMGDLLSTSWSSQKPFQMFPVLNIQKDVDKLAADSQRSTGEDVMSYLREISLHIDTDCPQDCPMCGKSYRQFHSCSRLLGQSETLKEMDMNFIMEIMKQVRMDSFSTLHILGGNIFSYSSFEALTGLLNSFPCKKVYHIHYLNFIEAHENDLKALSKGTNTNLDVLFHFPIDPKTIEQISHVLTQYKLAADFSFIIQEESEVDYVEQWVRDFHLSRVKLLPYYNGSNLSFFENCVYVEKAVVIESRPTMKDIFSRLSIDSNFFGKIHVLSSGEVYSDFYAPVIGRLDKETLIEILSRELKEGKSWRRTRARVEPCRGCTFEGLCPPISRYEGAIGKNNLCHIPGNTPLRGLLL